MTNAPDPIPDETEARLNEAIREANLAKSKFVSVVSHELRLPMTSIKGYTDLILQGAAGPVTPQQRDVANLPRGQHLARHFF